MPRGTNIHPLKVRAKTAPPTNTFIGYFIFVVAVAEPLANIPQIFTVFYHQNAAGVSITSWALYFLFAATWLWYGIAFKIKPTIIGGALFMLTDICVIIGACMYGGKIF